ncbi:MAG: AAA family ATPase [Mesoflavibacter sp.]|nr:AAA family ATPase [Mesoflavibacter sp.]
MIKKLKKIIKMDHTSKGWKLQQLLAFIQGPPGAGKSFVAKKLAEELGQNIIMTGTTHNAARQVNGFTINELLHLGRNTGYMPKRKLSGDHIADIQDKLDNIQLIVIDEISMMTPVTLHRVDLHLRIAFDGNFPFGGKNIILIGDMWQFPPVEQMFQNKAALYQAVVRVARGEDTPNEAYTDGAEAFMKFKMVKLKGQERASERYNTWLKKLRNPDDDSPIDDKWLKDLNILKAQDLRQNQGTDWAFTPIIVTGHHERREIIKHKMMKFGEKYNEPILRWTCPMSYKSKYKEPSPLIANVYKQLTQYFVRGAKCMLSKSAYGF